MGALWSCWALSATQAWVDAMSSRDVDRVVALYDAEGGLVGNGLAYAT